MEEEKIASTVQWRIENIKARDPDDLKTVISSPDIVLNNLGENDWKLNFHRNDRGQLDISLSPARFVESVSIHCEWSLSNGDGGLVFFKKESECEITSHESRHFMLLSTEEEKKIDAMIAEEGDLFLSHDAFTVTLRIRMTTDEDSAQSSPEHVSLVTRLMQESLEEWFGWNIENFVNLRLGTEAATTVRLRGHAFRMKLFLTGEALDDAHLGFGVFTEEAPRQDLTVTISLIEGKVICDGAKHVFNSSVRGQTWIVPKLASRREILDSPNDYLRKGCLILLCTFDCRLKTSVLSYVEESYCGPARLKSSDVEESYCGPKRLKPSVARSSSSSRVTESEEKKTNVVVTTVSSGGEVAIMFLSWNMKENSQKRGEEVLLQDIAHIYESRILSDFELRTKDGGAFPVHRNILAARSPVFRAMFCGDMVESRSGSLEVPDVDRHTMEAFLSFLYTGSVSELNCDAAVNLYYAADKYHVNSLKQQCSSVLGASLTASNVIDVLELAIKHQDEKLSYFVYNFILYNFDTVIFSNEWDTFLERNRLAGMAMLEVHKLRKKGTVKFY